MSSNKPLILITEDDPDDIVLLRNAIGRLRPDVVIEVARDGLELIDRLSDRNQAWPDLVLLDLNMPRMDGRELLVHVRTQMKLPPIDIVVYSTSSESEEKLAVKELGAAETLTKPSSFSEMLVQFDELLRRYLQPAASFEP